MIKWPSIESMKNALYYAHKYTDLTHITYRGKIKLHGTNAGVYLNGNEIITQSRSRVITPEDDNYGFATWAHETAWPFTDRPFTIYGEWFGKGINKGAATCDVEKRTFAPFGAYDHDNKRWICDPGELQEFFPGAYYSNSLIIPWHGDPITVDLVRPGRARDVLEAELERVEAEDPWIKEKFDISGTGEGLVYYPVSVEPGGDLQHVTDDLMKLVFKIKGRKHREKQTKQRVEIDHEALEGAQALAASYVTPARLNQCFAELGLSPEDWEKKHIGPIMKWMSVDIFKECQVDLEQSGLEWKKVNGSVMRAVRELLGVS